jgi:hypothetical protein
MNELVANMKRDERKPSGRQHSSHLTNDDAELAWLEMYDRIEGNDPCETGCRYFEVPHITHTEVQPGIEPGGAPDHSRREVDSEDRDALTMQIARDVPGAAADVGYHAAASRVFCKPVEKMAVERLVCQLGRKMLRVGFCRRVVAVANIHLVKALFAIRSLHTRMWLSSRCYGGP